MHRIIHNQKDLDDPLLFEMEEQAVIFYCIESKQKDEDKENMFEEALNIAHSFRISGLNPIYFMDPENNSLYVTSEEKLSRQYH